MLLPVLPSDVHEKATGQEVQLQLGGRAVLCPSFELVSGMNNCRHLAAVHQPLCNEPIAEKSGTIQMHLQ